MSDIRLDSAVPVGQQLKERLMPFCETLQAVRALQTALDGLRAVVEQGYLNGDNVSSPPEGHLFEVTFLGWAGMRRHGEYFAGNRWTGYRPEVLQRDPGINVEDKKVIRGNRIEVVTGVVYLIYNGQIERSPGDVHEGELALELLTINTRSGEDKPNMNIADHIKNVPIQPAPASEQ